MRKSRLTITLSAAVLETIPVLEAEMRVQLLGDPLTKVWGTPRVSVSYVIETALIRLANEWGVAIKERK